MDAVSAIPSKGIPHGHPLVAPVIIGFQIRKQRHGRDFEEGSARSDQNGHRQHIGKQDAFVQLDHGMEQGIEARREEQ